MLPSKSVSSNVHQYVLLLKVRFACKEIYMFLETLYSLLDDDIELFHGLDLFVKDHDCGDSIEKLYYFCGHEAIYIHVLTMLMRMQKYIPNLSIVINLKYESVFKKYLY